MNKTKAQVKKLLGITTDVELSEIAGCTNAACGLWKDNDPMPELWLWKMHGLFPKKFGKPKPVKRTCARAKK